jgi:DNA polymerase elongation subunit (family B)
MYGKTSFAYCLGLNYSSEREMLDDFYDFLTSIRGILTWNGMTFDIPYLIIRAYMCGSKLIYLSLLKDHCIFDHRMFEKQAARAQAKEDEKTKNDVRKAKSKLNSSTFAKDLSSNFTIDLTGMYHIDCLLRERARKKRKSYKLDAVAKDELKAAKDDIGGWQQIQPKWLSKATRELISRYNVQDSKLIPQLDGKAKYVVSTVQCMKICYINDYQMLTRGQKIRVWNSLCVRIVRYGWAINRAKIAAVAAAYSGVPYKGGYVVSPRPGLHHNVMTGDFSSLYPSIVIAFILCYCTLISPSYLPTAQRDGVPIYYGQLDKGSTTLIPWAQDPENILPSDCQEGLNLRSAIRKGALADAEKQLEAAKTALASVEEKLKAAQVALRESELKSDPASLVELRADLVKWAAARDACKVDIVRWTAARDAADAAQTEQKLKNNATYGFTGTPDVDGTNGKASKTKQEDMARQRAARAIDEANKKREFERANPGKVYKPRSERWGPRNIRPGMSCKIIAIQICTDGRLLAQQVAAFLLRQESVPRCINFRLMGPMYEAYVLFAMIIYGDTDSVMEKGPPPLKEFLALINDPVYQMTQTQFPLKLVAWIMDHRVFPESLPRPGEYHRLLKESSERKMEKQDTSFYPPGAVIHREPDKLHPKAIGPEARCPDPAACVFGHRDDMSAGSRRFQLHLHGTGSAFQSMFASALASSSHSFSSSSSSSSSLSSSSAASSSSSSSSPSPLVTTRPTPLTTLPSSVSDLPQELRGIRSFALALEHDEHPTLPAYLSLLRDSHLPLWPIADRMCHNPGWCTVNTQHPDFLAKMRVIWHAQLNSQFKRASEEINRKPLDIVGENVSFMLCTRNKKNYGKLLYEKPGDKDKLSVKGMASQRRDRLPVVCTMIPTMLDLLLKKQAGFGAAAQVVRDVAAGLLAMRDKPDISKLDDYTRGVELRDEKYKNPDAMPGIIAQRQIANEDEGRTPETGMRAEWTYVRPRGSKGTTKGKDKKSTIEFIRERELAVKDLQSGKVELHISYLWENHIEGNASPILCAVDAHRTFELYSQIRTQLGCEILKAAQFYKKAQSKTSKPAKQKATEGVPTLKTLWKTPPSLT